MSEYEVVNVERDSRHVINQLEAVGLLAGKYMSRAASQYGDEHPITAAFDGVCQRLTAASLEFQLALKGLVPDVVDD